ncbi:MAG: TAXI family TRAP transporter solute-binding subunit [Bacteriovoracaceae bacterium]|nr:TAXI family TRAP transporter solute-binding subunit [Bacteriovoracaceae bacterium]
MKKLLTYIFILVSVLGCSNGPDGKALNVELQTKLDTEFQKDLLKVKKLSRRGSYSYSEIGESVKRLMVYYKADLEFKSDYKLTDWNTLNVGSLSYILGATASGVQGIKSVGNKKGDVLTVFGTASYKKIDGKWAIAAPKYKQLKGKAGGQKKFVAEIDESEEYDSNLPEYKKKLKILGNIFSEMDGKQDSKIIQVAEFELQKILQKARMYSAMQNGVVTIATGSPLGNYFAIGKGLEDLSQKKNKTKAYATSGSVENCHLVNEKKVVFSIVQSDMAAMAYKGTELFKDSIPMKDMRAVAALYPEAFMIVTLKKANIRKFSDLTGKKISIGVKGSGHRADAIQVIKAHGFTRSDFSEIRETSFRSAIAELKNNAVDAIFLTGAVPLTALNKLNEEHPIHIVSLHGKIIKKLTQTIPVIPMILPGNTYKGQKGKIKTVGVTALIVTHKDTDKLVVEKLLSTLVDQTSELAKRSVQANNITLRSMRRGVTVPLHKGASVFYSKKRK